MITLLEKGIPFEKEFIDIEHKPDWFMKLSPFGRVPILVVNDKHVLSDSLAIIEYLDELSPGKPLHPKDPLMKAINRSWFEYITGMYESFPTLLSADEKTYNDKVREISERFQVLEREFQGPYFKGQEFTFLDVLLAPIFRQLDQWEDVYETGILKNTPKLREYRKTIRDRSSIRNAVVPDFKDLYRENMRKPVV